MEEITYSLLRQEDRTKILRSIFLINQETGSHDKRGSEESMWEWQYERLPTRDSLVYVANCGEEIIGYYHIPIYEISVGKEIFKIGHIQSVAVLKNFRNRNVFQGLSAFANKDANKHVDLMYSFPNKKSIHTFKKYNEFRSVAELPIYFLPLDTSKLIESKFSFFGFQNLIGFLIDKIFGLMTKKLGNKETILFINEIDKKVERIFNQFNMNHYIGLIRNKEFLLWRYMNSPKGKYRLIGLKSDEDLTAVAVLKEEIIFSCKCLILMDMAFKDIKDLQKLLTNLNKINLDKRGSFILVSGLFSDIEKLIMCGFVRIPRKLIPRKLNLIARWTNNPKRDDIFDYSSWLITLGDWDVF